MENLSNGWVCMPRADGYVWSAKRRTLLKEVWVPTQTAGCAGLEPTATAWSAIEKDASQSSLGADSDGWVCRPRADIYVVVGKREGRFSTKSGCRRRRLGVRAQSRLLRRARQEDVPRRSLADKKGRRSLKK